MNIKKLFFSVLLVTSLFTSFTLFNNKAFASTAITSDGGSGGEIQTVLCNVLKFVTGGIGKTIAAFIIIGMGIGFFTGKVSWAVLIGVTLGIASMFGAPAIVSAITGDSTSFCTGN